MHKICLLGGTGFVGRHLASNLIRAGWQVRIPTQQRERHRDLLLYSNIELVPANIHDQEQLNNLIDGCEVVINTVGILNESGNDGSGFHKVHVELPQKIVNACQANDVNHLLHISAINADVTEAPSHYLRTKGMGENLLHSAEGLNVTIFRPSVIFGKDDSFLNKFIALLRVPSPIFMLPSANVKLAPIWIEDVAAAMLKTIYKPEHYGKSYNLCGSTVYTLQDLVAYTAKLLQVKRFIIPLGNSISHKIALFMELIPGKPYSIDNYKSATLKNSCKDNNHLEQLGITPHSLEEVMSKYFNITKTHKELYSDFRDQARKSEV
ncbi:complex I NDUFA9 subunit family protein [Candidatus Halobeggiatoa sp. HSG11]|nr:complex I NDUFA9 subunit family protein [Candidatus Halobeggiatoa sp. HSG11]